MKRILTFCFMAMFLISLTNATNCDSSGFRGTFQESTEFSVGVSCPTCTYINWTITSPSGTITEQQAQVQGLYFYYEFNATESEEVGTYFMDGLSNLDTPVGICFEVTKSGEDLDTSEAIIYILLTLSVLGLFLLSLYFTIAVPYSNKIDDAGAVIKVTKTKYIKLALILLSYVLFVWVLNVLVGVSDNFVNLTMYYGFISFLFDMLNNIALPFSIFILILMFFEIIRDANIMKAISKFGNSR